MPISSYAHTFGRMELTTTDLQNEAIFEDCIRRGYIWIKRLERRFERIVREPTVGCRVELFTLQHPGCVELRSEKAKKLIQKVCYF